MKATQFFAGITTIDAAKQLYKKLALQFHPDRGGETAIMQEINNQYQTALVMIGKGENMTDSQIDSILTENEAYAMALNAIICLPGLTIELVGSWIWVTGNTFAAKETLKAAKYMYASAKKAWFFRTEEHKAPSGGKKQDLNEIKAKYGAKTVNNYKGKAALN
jgi:hypothetical protein